MTWGMHAIGYITAGSGYEAQAAANFDRSFANVRQPFLVWRETPTAGVTNFITGAGGFLQVITFGWFRLRISKDYVALTPTMMEGATAMENRGLQYLGRSYTVSCDAASAQQTVTLDSGEPLVVRGEDGAEQTLQPGASLSYALGTEIRLLGEALPVQGTVGAQRLFASGAAAAPRRGVGAA